MSDSTIRVNNSLIQQVSDILCLNPKQDCSKSIELAGNLAVVGIVSIVAFACFKLAYDYYDMKKQENHARENPTKTFYWKYYPQYGEPYIVGPIFTTKPRIAGLIGGFAVGVLGGIVLIPAWALGYKYKFIR